MRKILSIVAVIILLSFVMSIVTAGTAAKVENNAKVKSPKDFLDGKSQKEKEDIISQMSNKPLVYYAKKHGITKIKGKNILDPGITAKKDGSGFLADRPVGSDSVKHENEPSIAAKPTSNTTVVAASHYLYNPPCVAYRSSDGGETWSSPVNLPLLVAGDQCSDPVVRWAPDGSKVYAIYMNIGSSVIDIVVSSSTNSGASWSTPKIAIPGSASSSPDKPWGDTHLFWSTSNTTKKLYVTATNFLSSGSQDIVFTRSIDGGATFSPIISLATSSAGLQGSRPVAGKSFSSASGDVLVCWYNGEADGPYTGVFDIRCKASTNYGASFGSEITAVNDMQYELPYYLGPSGAYHRWAGGMFPSMVITYDGVAHMVFAADPNGPDESGEDGDIYYVKSARPYTSWTPPRTKLNTDTWLAQGYPTITAKRTALGGSILVASWEDHRNSPYTVPANEDCGGGLGTGNAYNCYYDIYSASTSPGGSDWAANPNKRITDVSSMSDYLFIGDYIDSSVNRISTDLGVQVIWTDRSDKSSVFDYEDDVYSDKIYTTN